MAADGETEAKESVGSWRGVEGRAWPTLREAVLSEDGERHVASRSGDSVVRYTQTDGLQLVI